MENFKELLNQTKENWMISDLHIHSRFSQACSKNITIPNLVKWAKIKGIDLLGTGDFSHPVWLQEIKDNLKDNGKGFYIYTAPETGESFNFIITGEISFIYTQEKGRKIHLVLLIPSIEIAEKINSYLDTLGRRDYDGRPIFGISVKEFTRQMKAISEDIEIIPAHCLPGNSLIHTNYHLKRIKDVKKGDLVYTHNNRWKKVTNLFSRKYSGKIYKIKPWYWTEGLETTPEHPFYAIKSYKCPWIKGLCKENCSKLYECKKREFKRYSKEWVPAAELKKGDFLVYPRFNRINNKRVIEKIRITGNLCRLIGYFLAEGYTIRNEGVGFSFNKNEKEYIMDVIHLMNEIFGKKKFKVEKKGGRDIIFYSKKINSFFSKFYNSDVRKANTKRVLDFMLELSLNKQIELFKGWYRGDKGYTTSRELINQMKIICLRLGIVPSIHKDSMKNHKKRGKHFIKNREIKANHDLYSLGNLSFFEDNFNLLKEKEFKRFNTKMNRRHGWIDENYIYLPIRKIEIENYNDYVYNLEIEEDNSYTSEFACIHNCWTPWFSLFGSMSGFDSIKEAFQEQASNIHAIETGISSDPEMNWRIKEFVDNKISILSFSDSHSFWPHRLGREATIFRKTDSFKEIIRQIRENDFIGTIEADPNYGKYHWDGHRVCDFYCDPKETKKLNGICPKCNKPLTKGVEYRVEEIAENPEDFKPENAKPFFKILPLHEVISFAVGVSMQSKKVWDIYNKLIENFGNEFNILLSVEKEKLVRIVDKKLAELILKNREGKIKVKPGYDGVYGEPVLDDIFESNSGKQEQGKEKQKTLF